MQARSFEIMQTIGNFATVIPEHAEKTLIVGSEARTMR